jgi:hypothetical protein
MYFHDVPTGRSQLKLAEPDRRTVIVNERAKCFAVNGFVSGKVTRTCEANPGLAIVGFLRRGCVTIPHGVGWRLRGDQDRVKLSAPSSLLTAIS